MVSEKKKKLVQKLTELVQAYPVIALVNMHNLPAKQLQNMRGQLLRKGVIIFMARKKLLQLALKDSQKPNIEQLIQKIKGMPALLLAKDNPFILCSILQKNKSPAPAKLNQIVPKDIVVPAGPTNFAPGPIISELAGVGIKTKVEEGKLVIVQDATVAKEGDTVSQKLAELLKRLDVQPMEIGLDLVAAWEKDLVFDAKQLYIDEEEYFNNVISAFQEAFNLSVEITYPTKDNIGLLLQKAFQESKGLALEQDILTDLTTEEILAKSEKQALSLKETANIETVERVREEETGEKAPVEDEKPAVKEEPKEEEKEEAPVEEKEEPKPKEPAEEEALAEENEEPKPEEVKEESPAEKTKEEIKTEEKADEEKKEEPKEEETGEKAPVEDEKPAEEETEKEPVKEEPKNEEKEETEEKPVEEKEEEPAEEEKKEVVKETEEAPVEEETPEPEEEKTDIPSAEDMIKATKEKFSQLQPEKKEEVIEVKTSAEEMIKATREAFDPKLAKEPQPSAEELVAEEKKSADKGRTKKDNDVEEVESLFEKLKKQGTLRK
jgi:large subunit ribosomal protein L10